MSSSLECTFTVRAVRDVTVEIGGRRPQCTTVPCKRVRWPTPLAPGTLLGDTSSSLSAHPGGHCRLRPERHHPPGPLPPVRSEVHHPPGPLPPPVLRTRPRSPQGSHAACRTKEWASWHREQPLRNHNESYKGTWRTAPDRKVLQQGPGFTWHICKGTWRHGPGPMAR